jgi:hypothetical protein
LAKTLLRRHAFRLRLLSGSQALFQAEDLLRQPNAQVLECM